MTAPPLERSAGWQLIIAAIVGPIALGMVFLGVFHWINDAFPVEGNARATRDQVLLAGFGFSLVALVVLGGWRTRGWARVVFVLVSIVMGAVSFVTSLFFLIAP